MLKPYTFQPVRDGNLDGGGGIRACYQFKREHRFIWGIGRGNQASRRFVAADRFVSELHCLINRKLN